MTKANAFQTHPINHVDFSHEPVFMNKGIRSLHSLIHSIYQQDQRGLFITLDGTHGADLDGLLTKLRQQCDQDGITLTCDSTSSHVKPEAELRAEMARYLTDNRAFGYKASDVHPLQYFRQDARQALRASALAAESNGGIHVLHGPGAYMLAHREPDLAFYADYSRENQQRRHAEHMGSFGFGVSHDKVETYKNCLFLEWPVWETYRRDWLSIHGNRSDQQATTSISTVRMNLYGYPPRAWLQC